MAISPMHHRLSIPEELVGDAEKQGQVFDSIAGSQMGLGSKRGRPYTWIPAHLADGRGEISPRTFLHVIKAAAEWSVTQPPSTAIDFQGIQEGVRRASSSRLAELEKTILGYLRRLSPYVAFWCRASRMRFRIDGSKERRSTQLLPILKGLGLQSTSCSQSYLEKIKRLVPRPC